VLTGFGGSLLGALLTRGTPARGWGQAEVDATGREQTHLRRRSGISPERCVSGAGMPSLPDVPRSRGMQLSLCWDNLVARSRPRGRRHGYSGPQECRPSPDMTFTTSR
jgi:hypothetical protein